MFDIVLSTSLRPKCISDYIGQSKIKASLEKQFESNRVPHFFIISGQTGIGKSTLAKIIALSLQYL